MSGINCQLIVCILVVLILFKNRIDNYLAGQDVYRPYYVIGKMLTVVLITIL